MNSVPSRPQPGMRLGPYEIEALLGMGGMGEVFRAMDTRLHRAVAIKVLAPDKVADPDRKRRFLQEARAASALNHPNIVTLHDISSDCGVDFLVMEYVQGRSLEKLITSKGLPLLEALGYAQQIAGALAAAHSAGIVHRDIKPANVIVTASGQVKVLDFGLAKLTEHFTSADGELATQSALTEAGTVMGTVAYMSPEQAGARPLDHRTDIFSLGIMLYEMVSGSRPFAGKSPVETLHAIITLPAPPLARQPWELNEILDKALAKDPADRYQHAGDLGIDLRRFQRAFEAESLPSSETGRALGISGSWRPWLLPAAVALALIAGAVVAWHLRDESASMVNPLSNAAFTRLTDFEGSELAAEISPDGRFVAFVSDRDGPFDLFLTQVGTGRFVNLTQGREGDVLDVTHSTGFTSDGSELWLRGGPDPVSSIRLMPLMGGPPRMFLQGAVAVSWAPDGSRIVYHLGARKGDPIFVADRNGANARQIFIDPNPGWHCHFPVWSRDAKWIYFVRGNLATAEMDLWRISPTGGEPERLTHRNSNVAFPAPVNLRTVLYVSPAEDRSGPWLYALDVDRGVSQRVSVGLEQFLSVAVSADGQRVVATVANPTASLWTIPIPDQLASAPLIEEHQVKRFALPTLRALAPRFGGGSLFYLSSLGGGDGLWRHTDNQVTEIWKGSEGALLEPPAVSSDGLHIAISLRQQGKIRLSVMNSDGTGLRSLAETIDIRGSGTWSPDGRWIAIGGTDARGPGLFKIAVTDGSPVRLTDKPGTNPVWSPDGDLIVYSGPAVGRVQRLLAVRANGTEVAFPEIKVRIGGERYRFLPNGKALIYMAGQQRRLDFMLLDLSTGTTRLLTHFNDASAMRTFDITPDGRQIVFDRLRENSDIVLIDLPQR